MRRQARDDPGPGRSPGFFTSPEPLLRAGARPSAACGERGHHRGAAARPLCELPWTCAENVGLLRHQGSGSASPDSQHAPHVSCPPPCSMPPCSSSSRATASCCPCCPRSHLSCRSAAPQQRSCPSQGISCVVLCCSAAVRSAAQSVGACSLVSCHQVPWGAVRKLHCALDYLRAARAATGGGHAVDGAQQPAAQVVSSSAGCAARPREPPGLWSVHPGRHPAVLAVLRVCINAILIKCYFNISVAQAWLLVVPAGTCPRACSSTCWRGRGSCPGTLR